MDVSAVNPRHGTGADLDAMGDGGAIDPTVEAAIKRSADRSIVAALVDALRTVGPSRVAVEDGDGRVLTYRELVRAVAALSRVVARSTERDTVAVLLPSSAAAAIAYLAILAAGKTPAMLNFTAGRAKLTAAVGLARADTVLTAKRFIDLAKLDDEATALSAVATVLALEDLRNEVGRRDKAFALVAARFGLMADPEPDETAAIVFTSGAEGDPKAVALSHRNLLSNVEQIVRTMPLERARSIFNPLPVFHSFGLGPGLVLPLVTGRKLVVHPSPLRPKEIVGRIKETDANVLFATDTFLRHYLRAAEPGALNSLQFAVCGAERVRPETREMARTRFGFTVLEGYGVTETSPVISVNHPDDIRDGTVGRPLPMIETRLQPVEGLSDGGRLFVRGPNVMKGYIDRAGNLIPPPDGWHDTGDVAAVEDGRLIIKGRLKRFAKIGGEMTSLVTVENLAGRCWPEALHAAAVVPGGRKGETIVLFTEQPGANADALRQQLRADGLTERYMPEHIVSIAQIPLLGTGKVDFVNVTKMAAERLNVAG